MTPSASRALRPGAEALEDLEQRGFRLRIRRHDHAHSHLFLK
jgi:hypothetical protein